jgi:hypothetical protein
MYEPYVWMGVFAGLMYLLASCLTCAQSFRGVDTEQKLLIHPAMAV